MDINITDNQYVLDSISRHCPEAMGAYLAIYNLADEHGAAFFSKDKVENDMSDDFRSFRNRVKKLAREGLLEWHPFNNGIAVTLAAKS